MRHETIGAGTVLGLLLLAGCRVEHSAHGDGKDVNLQTPFGGLSVETAGKNVPAMVGLPVYPGATPKRDSDGTDAANVNLSFGSFHLGVKAAGYTTPDAPGKVLAFYRGELGRYGTVIECRGQQPVGTPTVTSAGLSCKDDEHSQTENGKRNGGLELKAGSRTHQHVVSVDPRGSGTEFGLVLLDLPESGQDSGSGTEKQ